MKSGDSKKILQNGYFRGTPFHNSSSKDVSSGFWYGWGEFVIPDVYSSMHEELYAIRNSAAIIDMSPLPKMVISGPDSTKLLDKLMTRNISKLTIGRCIYAPWCNEEGLLIGDGLIFRLSLEEYLVTGENSVLWFQSNIKDMVAEVIDKTYNYGILSLQGPCSEEIISATVEDEWKAVEFSVLAFHKIAGIDVFIARQGFTGEKGYEIWTPNFGASEVREKILELGKKFGAIPAGEYAVDVARIEAGLICVSADYAGAGPDPKSANETVDEKLVISPIEAGLERLIEYDNRDFIGKKALKKLQNLKEKKRFLGLHINLRDIIDISVEAKRPDEMLSRVYWGSTKVFSRDKAVGRASSICWSPTLNKPVAFCFVDENIVNVGDDVNVEIKSADGKLVGLVSANVVNLPFIRIRRSEN